MSEECNIYLVMQIVGGVYDMRRKEYTSTMEEVTGIFDSLEKAKEVCVTEDQYIMPLVLNKAQVLASVEVPIIDYKGNVIRPGQVAGASVE